MKKILILGSEGFIGSHLVSHFIKTGYIVYGCDLYETTQRGYNYLKVSRLSPEFEEIFTNIKFDYCINAAGSGNVPYSISHPLVDFEANALDVIRILDVIRRLNPDCHYLHISSAAVYGNPVQLPIAETDQKHPLSPYGWHKLISESICAEYHAVYNLKTAIIRPFSVYGNGLRKQLLWDICKRLKSSDSIELFGTGNESRDFIHCSDLSRLIGLLIQKAKFTGEVYNAASGVETSIRKVADVFEQYYNGKKSIIFSGEIRKGDPLNWRADISAIMAIDFLPSIAFEDGIYNYIRWFDGLPNFEV